MTVLDLAKRWAEPPHVLLVEDASKPAKKLGQVLSNLDCAVNIASSLSEALRAVALNKYDAILIDMKDSGGVEAVQALKTRTPATPILMVVGDLNQSWLNEAMTWGRATATA